MYVVLGIYIFIFILLRVWWGKLRAPEPQRKSLRSFRVSVIIPVRNEEHALPLLLKDLQDQLGEEDRPEIVVVDDHSVDRTSLIVKDFAAHDSAIKLVSFTGGGGKKCALREGIHAATGELIITLDGDVRVGPSWLHSICNHHRANRSKLIILPVMTTAEKSVAERLQALELISLLAVTASSARAGTPLMCSGANLAFPKVVWEKMGPHHSDQISSGDDMFFLLRLRTARTGPIHWLHDQAATAWTNSPESILGILQQRIRWASKSVAYREPITLLFTGLVWLTNFAGLLVMVLTVFGAINYGSAFIWFALKTAADVTLAFPAARWLNKGRLLWFAPLLALIYPIYSVFISIAGLFYRPKWKGRTISLRSSEPRISAS